MAATRVMVRTSERTQFCQCRQRWAWAYLERLKPRASGINALVFGSMIHRCLAEWYIPERGTAKKTIRGRHPAKTFELLCAAMEGPEAHGELRIVEYDDEKWVKHKDLGMAMMTNYVDHFGLDERYMVIYPEMPFQYNMRNSKGQYICTYVGESDCLVMDRETRQLGLLEHKTAASISTDHLFLDEQASSYWAIVPMWLRENGILKPDQDLRFMMYNFLRKTEGDDRPMDANGARLNLDGTVSKRQPPPMFVRQRVLRGRDDRQNTYIRIAQQVREMKMAKRGDLEIYKSPSKDCVFCEFKDMCEMDEIGGDITILKRQAFRKWNPYKAHVWSLDLEAA